MYYVFTGLTIPFIIVSLLLSAQSAPLITVILGASLFFITTLNPRMGGRIVFFLLPFINVVSNTLYKYYAIPASLLVLASWLAAYIIACRKEKPVASQLTTAVTPVLLLILISAGYSLTKYISLFPQWNSVVTVHVSGKEVLLKNALGWIMLGYVQWSAGIAFLPLIYDWLKRYNDFNGLARSLAFGLLVSAAIAAYQKFINITFANPASFATYEGRVCGGSGDPNALAYLLFLAIAILVVLWLTRNGTYKYIIFTGIILAFILQLQTGTRIAFAGTLIFLFTTTLFILIRKDLRSGYLAPTAIMLAFGILAIFISSPTSHRIKNIFNNSDRRPLFSERIPYWETGVGIFKENALFGVGTGRYLLELPKYLKSSGKSLHTPNESACNYYVQIIAEFGVIGAVIFGTFFTFIIVSIIRTLKLNRLDFFYGTNFILAAAVIIMFPLLFWGVHFQNIEVSMFFWTIVSKIMCDRSYA